MNINSFILLLFTSFSFAQNTNGYLRRQNTQLVNNDGVVVLKGVNLGNWLHIEPYMINAPTAVAGSFESLHTAITNVTGSTAQADTFFTTWRNTFIQKKDIDSIAAMGFNHVRVPFPYQLFYNSSTNTYIADGFVYLDNVVQWCKLNNIYAILDLHHAPGGQIDGGLWSNYAVNKEITKQIWKNIALHYATETAVGGYDILNEPLISAQSEQWKLKDLYQAITTEIRTVDTNHLLFFEGNWYASSFWELTDGTPSANDRWDENMALSQHVYWVPQPSSTNQWTNTIANAMNVPTWCGEAGENANHWLHDWVKDCENTNSSWCLWTYKKAGGTSSLYSNPYNANYQAVLDFWNGGTQPSQANAIAGLQQFAQQSDLDFCTYKKDVKDALLRANFNTVPIPFAEHILPATIQAVDYDMGANGVAYSDTVFQSTGQGANFTNYNNGWVYRNDGVDIETWTGSPTVGSIDTNEWMHYTVQVPTAGLYEVSLHYAAPNAVAKVVVESNGNILLPETTLNATGGWGSWQYSTLGMVQIESQSAFGFKLKVTQNGLNIKALKFEAVDVTSVETIADSNFANAIRNLYPSLIAVNSNTLTPAAATFSGVLDLSGWGNATKSDGTPSAFAAQPKLTSIEGIAFFEQIAGLDVSYQSLTSLPDLPNTLIFIKANHNQMSSLPSSLPSVLEYLRVSQNNLTQLPNLPASLKALKCDYNQLQQLPSLPNSLAYLDVSQNTSLGCLPIIPNDLTNNSLPTSSLTTYVFSSHPARRVDFSSTAIQCVPNFYANVWAAHVTHPIAPGGCWEVPILNYTVNGASDNQNNGSVTVIGVLPSPNGIIEYKIDNGNYQDSGNFTGLSAGNHTVYTRRKSMDQSCPNPDSSVQVQIPEQTQQDFYVSPLGNDLTGNGTQENPYKTISKALSTTFSGSGDTIHLAEGVYVEDDVLTIPNQVSLIGAGSKTTHVRVNVYYNPFHYPTTNEDEPMWRDYAIDYSKFSLQIQGGYHTIKGFSLDGQEKKCVGAFYGNFAHNSLFEDIDIQNFRYAAYVLQNADDTTITENYIKNSTYGTFREDKACIFIDGYGVLIKKNTIILNENLGGYGIKNSFPNGNIQFFQLNDLLRERAYFLNITIEDNTILVNRNGMWFNSMAPGFVFENVQTCENCVVRNNIFNNMLSLIDGGPHSNGSFYSGPRYDIYNNTFNLFDYGYTIEANAPNIEFHHNYVTSASGGLDITNGLISTSNDTNYNGYFVGLNIHHNVFHNMNGRLSGWEIQSPAVNFKFNNNTVINSKGGTISFGQNFLGGAMELKNNIFANLNNNASVFSNQMGLLEGGNTTISNNLFYNIAPYGANTIESDPMIIGAGLIPQTFFHLKKLSPAIDSGMPIPGTTDGFKGAAPDLGAFESDFENTENTETGWLGIGTDRPEFSAALDVLSNSQGILIPRLTLSNIQNMSSPAEGLLVFCTDCDPVGFYYSDGVHWQKQWGGISEGIINAEISTSIAGVGIGTTNPNGTAMLDIESSQKGFLLPRVNTLEEVLQPTEGLMVYLLNESTKGVYFYNGREWQRAFKTSIAFPVSTAVGTNSGNNVGINTSTPHGSSILEINSTTKGILPPRLSKQQMEAIKSPALGLMVYCYDCQSKGYYYNNGTHWQNTVVTPPSVPQNVKATPNGNSATVTFSATVSDGGSPIISYTIISKPGDVTITTTDTTALFSNLSSSVAYVFLVSANNSEGASDTVATNPIIVSVPDAPTNAFAIRGMDAGTAEVYFTPPVYTGSSPITNYTVTQMPNNISFTTTQIPFIVSGLNINSTYTFTIKANNSFGAGLPAVTNAISASTAITATPKVLDAITVTPTVAFGLRLLKSSYTGPSIDVRRASDNQIMTIGFDNEGLLNTGLLIDFCGTSSGYITKWYDQSGNEKHIVNSNAAGQPQIYNGVNLESINGKPTAKFMGNATFLQSTQSVLSSSNELTTFTVAYAGYYQDIIQHGHGGGKGHFYNRREFANYGFGLSWNNLSENVYLEYHTQPILNTITCRNSATDQRRHFRRDGNNSVSVNTHINANFSNDVLTMGNGFAGHIGEHIEYESYINLDALEHVENNQSIYYAIPRPCLANSVPPAPPTQVFASSNSSTSASISFIPSTSSGSRPLQYYEVVSTPGNFKATGTASPIIVEGLTTNTTYSFTIKAVNMCDESSIVAISNDVLLGQMDAPTNVIAQKGLTEGSAVISFTPPTFTNGEIITGYTVTSTPDNISVTGNSSPITITGLSDIKKYTFQVVANTATTSSLPSLVSNSVYTHTQIVHDLPTPNTAFALRKLLSTYNGPAIQVRRNDNAVQDIGFLPNGVLDEASLLAFAGSGDAFVIIWYDQTGNARHLSQTNFADQPKIMEGGVINRKNQEPTIRFYASDKLFITSALTGTHTFHSVWNAQGPYGRWGYLVRFQTSVGDGGISFTGNNTELRCINNGYNHELIYVNNVLTNDFAPLNQLKTITTHPIYTFMPDSVGAFRIGEDLDYFGGGFGCISNFMMFTEILTDSQRQSLDKRESACFELGF